MWVELQCATIARATPSGSSLRARCPHRTDWALIGRPFCPLGCTGRPTVGSTRRRAPHGGSLGARVVVSRVDRLCGVSSLRALLDAADRGQSVPEVLLAEIDAQLQDAPGSRSMWPSAATRFDDPALPTSLRCAQGAGRIRRTRACSKLRGRALCRMRPLCTARGDWKRTLSGGSKSRRLSSSAPWFLLNSALPPSDRHVQ